MQLSRAWCTRVVSCVSLLMYVENRKFGVKSEAVGCAKASSKLIDYLRRDVNALGPLLRAAVTHPPVGIR